MHPVLFEIGGFKVHSFGLLILIAFLVSLAYARSRAQRFGFKPDEVSDILFWTLIAGVLGARVVYVVQDLLSPTSHFRAHPGDLLSLQFEGLTSFGALLFGFFAIWIGCKRRGKPLGAILDISGAAFLVGHSIGRIGCLLNGCCHGGLCEYPWGVSVVGRIGLFHPAQVYDSVMNLVALGILLRAEKGNLAQGQSFALFLMLHGLTRFLYEFFRAGASSTTIGSSPFTEAHVAALAMMAAGAWLFARARTRKSEEKPA